MVDPNLLVGNDSRDDALVYQLRPDLCIVQTVDFFMPIVDDPEAFGRIAAANAISDVYAMGATPVTALAILGIPLKKLGTEVAAAIMRGGTEVCNQAGIRIAGGHSIDDTEPKFGLCVTGVAHPDDILRNDTGSPGDLLVLTKPLGTGVLSHALKKGEATDAQKEAVIATMTHLNKGAADAAREVGVTAATDVTGFALLGHASEMGGHDKGVELWIDALPVLDGVLALIERGIHPGATNRNLDAFEDCVHWGEDLTVIERKLVADAQTSGGLLLAVSPDKVEALQAALRAHGTLAAHVVGRLTEGSGVRVVRR